MKKNDPEEVHQMRETLHQFAKVARTVSAVQGRLRESFTPPPPDLNVMERVLVSRPKMA